MESILTDTINKVPISFAALQQATKSSDTLQLVTKYIREGWPSNPTSITDTEVIPFYHRRESLSLINDCVMFHDRVVVPSKFQRQIMKQFHRGHPGIVRMKSIVRSFIYWPGIDRDIEDFVKQCSPCATAGKSPTKTTLESWPVPAKPWSRIHIDYAGPVDGMYFLVVVDPYTKWPDVYATRTITAKATMKLLNQTFSIFGVPETIVSDNGTQFTSYEFRTFCEQLGIKHIRSAPFHPQSNGLAERFVDTLKRSLRKIRAGGDTLEEAFHVFLQVYRTTPIDDLDGRSPAEMMFQRPIRTVFSMLKPPCDTISLSTDKTAKQNETYNKKHGAVKRQFSPGDTVYAQIHQHNSWNWEKATIIEKIGKVNYNVYLEERQRLIRSHANQLKLRISESVIPQDPSPLSVFFDGFGLSSTELPKDDTNADELVISDVNENPAESDESFYSEGDEEDVTTSIVVPVPERERRLIRLPARFQSYWMT